MRGEKIYEMDLDLTGVTDFGVSMDAITTRKEAIPLQGARFDLAVDCVPPALTARTSYMYPPPAHKDLTERSVADRRRTRAGAFAPACTIRHNNMTGRPTKKLMRVTVNFLRMTV
jgi:hypothetical protein